jgi:hypothetical protein
VPWFSDTGRADAGCDVGGGSKGVGRRTEASWVVFAGAGGEFAGAGGEFDGAAGAFRMGRLILVLPAFFKLAAAASIASAALVSEFWGFGAGISEFTATGGGPDFTDWI